MADRITLEQGGDFDYVLRVTEPDGVTPTALKDSDGNLLWRVVFTARPARGSRHVSILLDTAATTQVGTIDIEPEGDVGVVLLHIDGGDTLNVKSVAESQAEWELALVTLTDPDDREIVDSGPFATKDYVTGPLT